MVRAGAGAAAAPLLACQAAVQLLARCGVCEDGVRLGDALEQPVRVVAHPLLCLRTADETLRMSGAGWTCCLCIGGGRPGLGARSCKAVSPSRASQCCSNCFRGAPCRATPNTYLLKDLPIESRLQQFWDSHQEIQRQLQ